MIVAGIAVAFFSAAAMLYFRLGAITHGLHAVKETLDMLLRKWDTLRCGTHETRLAEFRIMAENVDGRVVRLENRIDRADRRADTSDRRADTLDRHGADSDERTGKVEVRVDKVEKRVDGVEEQQQKGASQ